MKRVSLLFACFVLGCLEPNRDAAYLAKLDDMAPQLVRTQPLANGNAFSVAKETEFTLVFSEPMDSRTLRPGIVVLQGLQELNLIISVPPDETPRMSDPDFEYHITVKPVLDDNVTPLPPGTYQLVLRTLLADAQGNAFPAQLEYSLTLQ